MMADLLVGDEGHVRQSLGQLGLDVLYNGVEYSSYPSRPSNIMNAEQMNEKLQQYYFKLEGSFHQVLKHCLEVSKVGDVHSEKQYSSGRADLVINVPMHSKTILYELKVGVGNVSEALNQLLNLYATAYLNDKTNVICIAVSLNTSTRRPLTDWMYAEYDEKGKLLKFFSHKPHNVTALNIHNITIA